MTIVIERIDALIKAIHESLMATGAFKTGSPHVRKEIGERPAFEIWWDGFSGGQDMRSDPGPGTTTHRFQVELFVSLSSNLQESQQQLWRLAGATMGALKANNRLNGTCVRSRVTSGKADLLLEEKMLGLALILEADCMGF